MTLLDGKIAAINRENGSTVWVFDTDTALISARGSQGSAFTVVPGVQGELYTQAKGSQAGFQVWSTGKQDCNRQNLAAGIKIVPYLEYTIAKLYSFFCLC